jgi:hypothetical protein
MKKYRNAINDYRQMSLSNYDILNLLEGKTKIISYPELTKYKNIFDALKPYGSFVLLYLTKPNYGHWTCVISHLDRLEVFDSYGDVEPDEQLDYVPMSIKKRTKQDFPYLTKLLYESGMPVEYNNFKFQKYGNGTATCGRHVATRLLFKNLYIDDYVALMKALSKKTKLNYDELVTLLTMYINK